MNGKTRKETRKDAGKVIHRVLKPGRKTQKSEAKDISPYLNIKWDINEQVLTSVTLSK